MPIVNEKAIHSSPRSMLKYILNGDKNEEAKYASGINTSIDIDQANDNFKNVFELYSGESFNTVYGKETNDEKKKVRIHHYIQSFAPGEVTPEEAHAIGLEWAKQAFGNNRQIICSTHIDRKHIHNHFAVASYSMDGSHWISNLDTLAKVRKLSDSIALQHGLNIIKNPNRHGGVKYKEYIEKRKGTSWKQNIRNDIDKIIVNQNVNSLDDLLSEMQNKGYFVRQGKFITFRGQNNERGVRSYKLGVGYSEQDLIYRIKNKDKEYSIASIMQKYKGIQVEYALCIRQIQIIIYHKEENPFHYSIRDIQQTSDALTWMYNNNIGSLSDFEIKQKEIDKLHKEKSEQLEQLNKQIQTQKKIVDDYNLYSQLINKIPNITEEERNDFIRTQYCKKYDDKVIVKLNELMSNKKVIENEINNLHNEKYIAASMCSNYKKQITDDFSIILEEIRKEKQEVDNIKESVDINENKCNDYNQQNEINERKKISYGK